MLIKILLWSQIFLVGVKNKTMGLLINNILPHPVLRLLYCLGIELRLLAIKQKVKYKSVKVICVQAVIFSFTETISGVLH